MSTALATPRAVAVPTREAALAVLAASASLAPTPAAGNAAERMKSPTPRAATRGPRAALPSRVIATNSSLSPVVLGDDDLVDPFAEGASVVARGAESP
jgi:hypothetical protein